MLLAPHQKPASVVQPCRRSHQGGLHGVELGFVWFMTLRISSMLGEGFWVAAVHFLEKGFCIIHGEGRTYADLIFIKESRSKPPEYLCTTATSFACFHVGLALVADLRLFAVQPQQSVELPCYCADCGLILCLSQLPS